MVLFRFSWYYIFTVQLAFYFLRFEDKTGPHVTMATDFVGLVSDVMWTRKYRSTYFHYFCSSNQCKSIKHGIVLLFNRAGRDDVTTGKLLPSRGECLGLYRCVLIIFKRK